MDVIGLVENMSYYICPHCQERHEIFGHGGGRSTAERLELEFLAEIPIHERIRRGGDEGVPVVVEDPDSPQGRIFTELAQLVLEATRKLAEEGA